jgi:hypothetical protein
MRDTVETVILTRRRGDAEKDAEELRPEQQPSSLAHARLRSTTISAVFAVSGFEFLTWVLRVFLRVSASPRQIYGLLSSDSSSPGTMS